jgi:hypothetical protein
MWAESLETARGIASAVCTPVGLTGLQRVILEDAGVVLSSSRRPGLGLLPTGA